MRRSTAAALVCLTAVFKQVDQTTAAEPVFELTIDRQKVRGLVAGHDERRFYLIREDGRLETYAIAAVDAYKATGGRFRPHNAAKIRSELLKEFGRDYEVATSTRYVVVAPRGRAKSYLSTFDTIARTFTSYFSKRGIPLTRSRFPLVAVVFGTQPEFAAYARAEGVSSTENVSGYYLRTSNRVAAYEPRRVAARRLNPDPLRMALGSSDVFNVQPDFARVPESLRDTLVHEATHQMAFNTGLHSRVGHDPKWVIEGLATLFEPDAVRTNTARSQPADRINHQRKAWFESLLRPKWRSDTLTGLIMSDRMFQSDAGGAYALAWSLSFYLNEARPGDYSQYLGRLKARDHGSAYTPEQRLKDFQIVFGNDLRRFEAAFLRYMDNLPAASR